MRWNVINVYVVTRSFGILPLSGDNFYYLTVRNKNPESDREGDQWLYGDEEYALKFSYWEAKEICLNKLYKMHKV